MPVDQLPIIAARYADKLHFHIHPLKPKSKLPLTEHGLKDATDNVETIKKWWANTPDANISVATGAKSGVWVLDVDGPDGAADLAALISQHGPLPITPEQRTRNGRHIFFAHPGNVTIRNRAGIVRHDGQRHGKLDVRGDGGYVVIAPSLHPDGGNYEWTVKPIKVPFAPAPDWLLQLVLKPERPTAQPLLASPATLLPIANYRFAEKIINDQLDAVRSAFEGTRNDTLNIAALKLGKLIPCGSITAQQAHDQLLRAAIACGLDRHESEATIRSGLNAGIADPYRPRASTMVNGTSKKNDAIYDEETGEVIEENTEAGKEKKPNKFKLLNYSDLINMPPVQWVIDGILPEKSFGVIYGEPGKGKTFVALDIALCLAHGLAWHGREVVAGSVLYIAGEGVGGIGKRLKAWRLHWAESAPMPNFYALAANVNMRSEDDVKDIIELIDGVGQKFSMIFVDTVARAILGGDENSATDMGQLVAACDVIKEHTGATVIGIHHSGKDDSRGMRGSSALLGAVDTCLRVERDDANRITLKMEKQKDAEMIEDMVFEMKVIATGIDETSVVLVPTDERPSYQKRVNGKSGLALQFLYDAISQSTATVNGNPACTIEAWRVECFERNLSLGGESAKRMGFKRAFEDLTMRHIIASNGAMVWALNTQRETDDDGNA